jgi:hypothetical protein
MLGGQEGVYFFMCNLHTAGLIRYNRGKITIQNREGLEECSCYCYTAIRGQFEKLR